MPKPPAKKKMGKKQMYWVGGGVVIGGIAYIYYKRNAAASATPATTDPNAQYATDPYTGYDSSYGTGVGGAYGGYGGSPVTDPNASTTDPALLQAINDQTNAIDTLSGEFGATQTSSTAAPETNTQWMHEAIKTGKKHGYTTAAVTAAVTAYLIGAPMTDKQIHTIESIIGLIGPPPNGAPNPHRVNEPKHPKKKAVVKKGSISRFFGGGNVPSPIHTNSEISGGNVVSGGGGFTAIRNVTTSQLPTYDGTQRVNQGNQRIGLR